MTTFHRVILRMCLLGTVLGGLCGCGDSKPAAAQPEASAAAAATSPAVSADLSEAAFRGDVDAVRAALRSGRDVNLADDQGRTPLMLAAFDGHTAVVAALLDAGARINAQDASGRSALMYAASGSNADTVKLLLDRSAATELTDKDEHFTALMFAAAEGQEANVRLLLQRQADPLAKDVDGDTARNFALQRGHAAIAAALEVAERAAAGKHK